MVFELIRIEQSGIEIGRRQTCLYVGRDEDVRLYGGRWRHSIVGAGKWQVNDGLCTEVPLWWASTPIARRRIDLVCLEAFWLQEWEWVLEDCHKRSCWKTPIGMSVPVPYRSDVYVCLKSCWLCLTVVYWLLECNKVPSWIENPEYVTIYIVTYSQIVFHDGSLLDSMFSTQLLITVHSSSRILTYVWQILELQRIRLLSSSFSTGSLKQITNYNQ
jgi:hypothetical protein